MIANSIVRGLNSLKQPSCFTGHLPRPTRGLPPPPRAKQVQGSTYIATTASCLMMQMISPNVTNSTCLQPTEWQPSQDGLDRTLLCARDPILLYASVPLYVSELDDHGLSALECKVCTLTGKCLNCFRRVVVSHTDPSDAALCLCAAALFPACRQGVCRWHCSTDNAQAIAGVIATAGNTPVCGVCRGGAGGCGAGM